MRCKAFIVVPVAILCPVLAWAQATCSSGSSGSTSSASGGGFTTKNGQIYGPNGQPFQARGVDVPWGGNMPSGDTLTQTFPGINFVRLAIFDYNSPAELSSYVSSLTSKGIVVELEDHNNGAGNAGGSQGQIFTGQALSTENNWYQQIGAAFKNNPDVWFGTNNEPSETNANGQSDPAALSQWQLSTYNAIRGTGNNNPILLEINGWPNNGQPQMAVGYTSSVYQGMTNVIGDVHYYGWWTNGSTDQATNSNLLAQIIQQTHQLTTANGAMPVIIGEYGPSTTGQDPADANAQQVISAVQSSGVGNVAWAWMTGDVGQDALLSSSGGLTSYGQEVQDYIKASADSCAGVPAITTSISTDTELAIASGTTTAPASSSNVLSANSSADTQPIDTTASSNGAEYAEIAGPSAADSTAVPMGPAPSTTVVSTSPVTSSPVTAGAAEQVVPTYGPGGSVNQAQTSASSSSSSAPSGDPAFSVTQGLPEQVVPRFGSDHATSYASSGTTNTTATQADVTPATYTTTSSTDPSDTPQLQTMMAQSYGQTAVNTSEELGVNSASVAAIAQAESGFRNVGTANGSTTATGPWQFTAGTFDEVSQSNNLGFSSSSLTDPNAQATEAPYYLQQIASTVGEATGQPVTTLQAYGAWVFGPNAGAQIATASSDAPLSSLVSAQSLANNGMSKWTVGDFRTAATSRLGPAASQTVLTSQGI